MGKDISQFVNHLFDQPLFDSKKEAPVKISCILTPPVPNEKYWNVSIELLQIRTQGTSEEDVLIKAKDAIELIATELGLPLRIDLLPSDQAHVYIVTCRDAGSLNELYQARKESL